MFVIIIEHNTFAFIPVQDPVSHADSAIVTVPGDDESEVDTYVPVTRALVRRNVITGGEDREPGVFQVGNLSQQAGDFRAVLAKERCGTY